MRSLIAAALSCAYADETSLMQARLQTTSQQLSTSKARHASSSKLLDTAVQLMKNGATPDVQEFIGATTNEIGGEGGIMEQIQREHDADQLYVDTLMARFQTAVDTLTNSMIAIGVHKSGCENSGRAHHQCRAEEAFACARSRRCEEQLRSLWVHVKAAEEDLREKHTEIHGERCVDGLHAAEEISCSIELCLGHPNQLPQEPYPNPLPHEPHCLTHCMDWSHTSSYPLLDYAHGMVTMRDWSVEHFGYYKVKKEVVERAWQAYNLKLSTCSDFEADLDAKSPVCDEAQRDMHAQCCTFSEQNMDAREAFGQEWTSLMRSYNQAKVAKDLDQMDRIAEWETLTIVECLLNHVYSSVEESIAEGTPCVTEDSDPDGVTRAIEDCHIVTRGCAFAWNHTFDRSMFADDGTEIPLDRGTGEGNTGVAFHEDLLIHTGPINGIPAYQHIEATGTWPINADSLTAHLCLSWMPIPQPPCPGPDCPVQFEVCDAAHVAQEQGSFLSDIQTDYRTALNAADDLADPLNSHLTVLSAAGWAGCAAPLICEQCQGSSSVSVDTSRAEVSYDCHLHEEYLLFGANDARTFRCLDGTCLSMSGRCNGISQCGDGSDEQGCDAPYDHVELQTGAAYLAVSDVCPANFNSDVFFPCGDGRCIEKLGLCNGIDNCGNGVDEAACSGDISISLEATSGRTITVEHLATSTGVFHDRQYYQFQSLGDFAGKTFIKYSNDDKLTDHDHVMTKIRTVEPMTVFIVAHAQLPWMGQSWNEEAMTGVTFRGQREIVRGDVATEWQDTRHKEWDSSLNTEDDFSFGHVFSKTFAAGTINIQGNTVVDGDHSDGSFLIFVERPSETPTHVVMVDGCENQNTEVSREVVHISEARTASVRCCTDAGDHCMTQDLIGGCAQDKTYAQAEAICLLNSRRLCTEDEILNRVCCGTGCQFDGHQIWVQA